MLYSLDYIIVCSVLCLGAGLCIGCLFGIGLEISEKVTNQSKKEDK